MRKSPGFLIPGGTAAVWAVQQLKPAFLSFWEVVILSPDGTPTMEMLTQWCKKSLITSLGSADGLFDFPKMPKAGENSKVYAAYGVRVLTFLSIFGVYRIIYRPPQ